MLIDPHRLTFKAIDNSGVPTSTRYPLREEGRLPQTWMTSLMPDIPKGWTVSMRSSSLRSTFRDIRDMCYSTHGGTALYGVVLCAEVDYGREGHSAWSSSMIVPHDDDWAVPVAGHFTDWLRCTLCSLNEILTHPDREKNQDYFEGNPYRALDARIRHSLVGTDGDWDECDLGVQLVIHAYTSWYKKWDERGAPIRLRFQGAVLGGPQHQTEYIKKDGTLGYRDRYRGERL